LELLGWIIYRYEEVLERTEQRIQVIVAEKRYRFAGHTLRLLETRPVQQTMNWPKTTRKTKKDLAVNFSRLPKSKSEKKVSRGTM